MRESLINRLESLEKRVSELEDLVGKSKKDETPDLFVIEAIDEHGCRKYVTDPMIEEDNWTKKRYLANCFITKQTAEAALKNLKNIPKNWEARVVGHFN